MQIAENEKVDTRHRRRHLSVSILGSLNLSLPRSEVDSRSSCAQASSFSRFENGHESFGESSSLSSRPFGFFFGGISLSSSTRNRDQAVGGVKLVVVR